MLQCVELCYENILYVFFETSKSNRYYVVVCVVTEQIFNTGIIYTVTLMGYNEL